MSDLSPAEEKLREEILSIREERRANQIKIYLEVVRTVALTVGAIIVFWAVQRPESILNQSASHEGIVRERAKLLLEWSKEPDSNKRLQALAIIKSAYGPSNDGWLRSAEEAMQLQARSEAVVQDLQLLIVLNRERQDKERQLNTVLLHPAGPGRGADLFILSTELSEIRARTAATKHRLEANGFDMRRLREN